MKTLIDHARFTAYIVLYAVIGTAAFSISLFEIFSGLFLIVWLAAVTREKKWGALRSAWALALVIYVGVNILSIIGTPYLHNGLKGAFRVLRWAVLVLAVTDVVDSRGKFFRIYDAILSVAVFIAVDALIQGLTGVEILRGRSLTAFYGETGRFTGPFPHANDFSAYLCLAFFAFAAALAVAWRERRRGFIVSSLMGAALVTVCLAMTYSRGAWLAVAAGLLLWAILRRSFMPIILIGVLLAAAYIQSPFLFSKRVASLSETASGTVSERRLLWGESVRMIAARPVLGFGANTYSDNVGRFKDPSHRTDRQYAHNGYLQIAAETGLIGLTSFLILMGMFLCAGGRHFFFSQADPGVLIRAQGIYWGVAALLLQSATDTTLQSLLLSGMLWIWIGLGWAAVRLLSKRSEV